MARKKKNPLLLSAASIGMEKLIELGINKSMSKMNVKQSKPAKMVPKKKPKSTTQLVQKTIPSEAAPVSLGFKRVTRAPKRLKGKNGSIRIIFEEQVQSVLAGHSDGSFNIAYSTNVQPGNSGFAAWLQKYAPLYEQWFGHRVSYEYAPVNATSAIGDVIMGFEYNPQYALPSNSYQAMDKVGSYSGPVWSGAVVEADVSQMFPFGGWKYVRDGFVAGDLKTFDAGQFFIAFENCTNSNSCGKLIVRYDIEFRTPLLEPALVSPSNISMFVQTPVQNFTSGTTTIMTNWVPLPYVIGTSTAYQSNTITADSYGLNAGYLLNNNGKWTLPKGIWRVEAYVQVGCSSTQLTTILQIDSTTYNGANALMSAEDNQAVSSGFAISSIAASAVVTSNGTEQVWVTLNATGTTPFTGSGSPPPYICTVTFTIV